MLSYFKSNQTNRFKYSTPFKKAGVKKTDNEFETLYVMETVVETEGMPALTGVASFALVLALVLAAAAAVVMVIEDSSGDICFRDGGC